VTKRYLLIDGPSLMFRAFYVLPPLKTSAGVPKGALLGFLRMLLRAVQDAKADGVAVAMDIGTPFREEIYGDYKATRDKTPEDLKDQLERLPEVLSAIGVPVIGKEGLEADDVIAVLARRLSKDGHEVVIVTGDRDLLQLVHERIQTVLTKKGVSEMARYDVETFRKEYGFHPSLLPDYKALAGDASDNIPGVPGIGDKTARLLVSQYGSLESIYEHLAEIKPQIREKLAANRERAFQGRLLATLKDADELDLPMPRLPDLTGERAINMMKSLEFGSLLSQYAKKEPAAGLFGEAKERAPERDLNAVWQEIRAVAEGRQSRPAEYLVWDEFWKESEHLQQSEESGLKRGVEGFRGLAQQEDLLFATNGKQWSAIKVSGGAGGTAAKAFNQWRNAARTGAFFADDWKRVLHWLKKETGEDAAGAMPCIDLSLAAFLLDPEGPTSVRGMLKRYLGDREVTEPKDLAVALVELATVLQRELEAACLDEILRQWEIPFSEVLARMEDAGIRVDTDALDNLSEIWRKEIEELERTAEVMLGKRINLSSPKQVAALLFEELGLPRLSKDSTAGEVLEQLKDHHPIVNLILRHRTVSKLRSTYAEALKAQIDADGKVRTTFLQTGTATGRLSSREPNLQNIPVRGNEAVLIRRAFVPSDETKQFLSVDYSQIDLRMLAHLSGDEELIKVFREGGDVHTEAARRLFGITGAVDPEARRRAKVVNFGIIYLMSDYGLSQELGCSREEAGGIIRGYFERFPGVKEFVEATLKSARETGYVTTLLGRRRWVRDVNSQNTVIRKAAERVAVNTRVQGSTADLLMMAMVEVTRKFLPQGAVPLLQIHDEILFEVPSENLKIIAKGVKMLMENVTRLKVPLEVHLKKGRNWGDLEAMSEEDSE
jgi:DNA polymerase-1